VDAEMRRDFPITIGTGSVYRQDGDIPIAMTYGNSGKLWRWWSPLRLRNAQRVTFNLHLGLDPLHECFATQKDLLSKSFPDALPYTFEKKMPIVPAGFVALSPERAQQTVHSLPVLNRRLAYHLPIAAPGPVERPGPRSDRAILVTPEGHRVQPGHSIVGERGQQHRKPDVDLQDRQPTPDRD
jgi:hypothetical protein